ncbi:MAG TPA: VOC family protein [Candidatus Acidoferrum sp.]|nr:VOC family protein [Candidatus Acidoferrum sp.]
MATKPIPDGYHTVTPHLTVQGASKVLDFVKRAFDAKEIHRMAHPDGTLMHAEIKIGDSIVMMGEARGGCQPMPSSLYLYVPDAYAVYKRALQAGATSTMEPTNQFWGDRMGGVKDPAGNQWMIGTHKEDVSPEELRKRAEAFVMQPH